MPLNPKKWLEIDMNGEKRYVCKTPNRMGQFLLAKFDVWSGYHIERTVKLSDLPIQFRDLIMSGINGQ